MPDPSQPLAGTLDIAIATRGGDVHHAVRRPDGTWQPFQLVFRHTSARNAVHQVNISTNRNGAGIFATMGNRNILQRMRPKLGGGWSTPSPITNGINVDHFAVDAASTDGGIVAVTGDPGPSRFVSAYFDRVSYDYTALDTPTPGPDLSTIPLPYITSLSTDFLVGEGFGQPIRLVMTDPSGGLYATARSNVSPYRYPAFVDVRNRAGDPGFMTGVDICPGGDAWFVCGPVDGGDLVYTTWLPSDAFTPFVDLKAEAGDPGAITDVSVSFFNGAFSAPAERLIHVLVATEDGGLFHAMRRPDGTFSHFIDVKAQAGDPGPVASVATDVNLWRYG